MNCGDYNIFLLLAEYDKLCAGLLSRSRLITDVFACVRRVQRFQSDVEFSAIAILQHRVVAAVGHLVSVEYRVCRITERPADGRSDYVRSAAQ